MAVEYELDVTARYIGMIKVLSDFNFPILYISCECDSWWSGQHSELGRNKNKSEL